MAKTKSVKMFLAYPFSATQCPDLCDLDKQFGLQIKYGISFNFLLICRKVVCFFVLYLVQLVTWTHCYIQSKGKLDSFEKNIICCYVAISEVVIMVGNDHKSVNVFT